MSEADDRMGSIRWAFRCGSWTPARTDWLFAARCVQPEEKDRIGTFVFAKDAKSAMVSCAEQIGPSQFFTEIRLSNKRVHVSGWQVAA